MDKHPAHNEVHLAGPSGFSASLRGRTGFLVLTMFFIIVLISAGAFRELTALHGEIIELGIRLTQCEDSLATVIEYLREAYPLATG